MALRCPPCARRTRPAASHIAPTLVKSTVRMCALGRRRAERVRRPRAFGLRLDYRMKSAAGTPGPPDRVLHSVLPGVHSCLANSRIV